MATYPSVYRARAVKYEAPVLTAFVPQVFGNIAIEITEVIGSPTQGMGWVFFQGGNPEFPVWQGGVGGGTVSDVVWAGPDAPTDKSIELWWDTDEEAPLDPRYLTQAVADPLYLTPAEGDARYPLGIVAYAQVTADQVTISTEVALTGLTVTWTAVAGRSYKIVGYIRFGVTTIDNVAALRIKESTTTFQTAELLGGRLNTQVNTSLMAMAVLSPSAGSHTHHLTLQMPIGTGSVNLEANTTSPSFILVEDIGIL